MKWTNLTLICLIGGGHITHPSHTIIRPRRCYSLSSVFHEPILFMAYVSPIGRLIDSFNTKRDKCDTELYMTFNVFTVSKRIRDWRSQFHKHLWWSHRGEWSYRCEWFDRWLYYAPDFRSRCSKILIGCDGPRKRNCRRVAGRESYEPVWNVLMKLVIKVGRSTVEVGIERQRCNCIRHP